MKKHRNKKQYLQRLRAGLTPDQQLEKIIQDEMCIGCGICQSIAGVKSLEMQLVEEGYQRPVILKALKQSTVDKIFEVCPGTHIEGLPDSLVEEDSNYDNVWGVWREMVLTHATDAEVRHVGSTGGLLTALGLYLIDSDEVDFVLHAKASDQYPTFGEPFVSRTQEDIMIAAGSRYGPTATLIDIAAILDQCEKEDETFAFIGTPCDVTALRNYATIDPRVDAYCKYQMAMVCGGFMAPQGLSEFLRSIQIDPEKVTGLRYRGFGCPGPTRIETSDGAVIEKNYLDFWGGSEAAWQLPFRCKVCADGIGDATDIAASDTWEGGSPTWQEQEGDLGTNAAIVRTKAGQHLMESAVRAGYVSCTAIITPSDMNRFQPHQENKKRQVWARFAGMRSVGAIVPDVRGLRLKPLARQNTFNENLQQAKGARRRYRNKDHN